MVQLYGLVRQELFGYKLRQASPKNAYFSILTVYEQVVGIYIFYVWYIISMLSTDNQQQLSCRSKESFQELGMIVRSFHSVERIFFVLVGRTTYEILGCPADKGKNYCTELNVSTLDFISFQNKRTKGGRGLDRI